MDTPVDFVGALRSFAEDKGWHFVYGNVEYANFEVDQEKYRPFDLILIADFNMRPQFAPGGAVESVSYPGTLMLGRKREVKNGIRSEASLQETMEEKYDNRLRDLITMLTYGIGGFACQMKMDITQCDMRMDINKFDLNADFVVAIVTFTA